jgi:hypothetical protein
MIEDYTLQEICDGNLTELKKIDFSKLQSKVFSKMIKNMEYNLQKYKNNENIVDDIDCTSFMTEKIKQIESCILYLNKNK